MPAEALFLFGTLRHAPLLHAVAGEAPEPVAAWLPDHAVTHAVAPGGAVQAFPLLVPRAGARAEGVLIRPSDAARARLDGYELAFGYGLGPVTVQTAAGPVAARVYRPQDGAWHPGPDWDFGVWAAHDGPRTTEVAPEVLALLPEARPATVLHRIGMLHARVASRQRARATPAPATLRRTPAPGDVQTEARRQPYAWFFGVEEADLRFRRFDASHSPPVTRAAFVMADAVTVLPYDPVRDRVLLVEQFRFGPECRGDPNPWSLEPIAGRIDAHETPPEAARREAAEEARLTLGALHPVGRYYVSPGAVTEYLFSYVAEADLPDDAAGLGGLESEAEDIRAHVIGFDRLMALVASGEVENAPLLVSAQWLALNRDRLRAPQ